MCVQQQTKGLGVEVTSTGKVISSETIANVWTERAMPMSYPVHKCIWLFILCSVLIRMTVTNPHVMRSHFLHPFLCHFSSL